VPSRVTRVAYLSSIEGRVCRARPRTERPVPLDEGVLLADGRFRFLDSSGTEQVTGPVVNREYRKNSSQDWIVPLVRKLVGDGKQVIVFRETKGEARGCALYLAPAGPGSRKVLPIRHAGNIKADHSLRGARVKVTLDRLRVADYPGGGTHRVLFDFYAQNQVSSNVEHVHFNVTCRVHQGEHAAIVGYLAVQIPEALQAIWDWNEWVYDISKGQVIRRQDPLQLIPYNYVVFSVSRFVGD